MKDNRHALVVMFRKRYKPYTVGQDAVFRFRSRLSPGNFNGRNNGTRQVVPLLLLPLPYLFHLF